LGNWLTAGEAAALWQVPDGQTLTGKRNRAILAILLGCGLRRRELAELTLESLRRREERWVIVDLVGKGRHIRTVPVPNWVKETLDVWLTAAGFESGPPFRCVCRVGKPWGDCISEKTVWHVVKKTAATMQGNRI
jgi:site-specific recombinase XerD